MIVPARRPGTTAEELFDLADDGNRTELVKGRERAARAVDEGAV